MDSNFIKYKVDNITFKIVFKSQENQEKKFRKYLLELKFCKYWNKRMRQTYFIYIYLS